MQKGADDQTGEMPMCKHIFKKLLKKKTNYF